VPSRNRSQGGGDTERRSPRPGPLGTWEPVKRVVDIAATRKPGVRFPANPDDLTRAVGPPARIFWCQRYPERTQALMCRRVYEHLVTGCVHESDAHCPTCADAHLVDLIAYLAREAHPGPRQGAGRK